MTRSINPSWRLVPFLILLWALLPARAANTIITATITVTNTAGTTNGQTITVNSDTRIWTNSVSFPAFQILTNNSIGGCATNLFAAVSDAPFVNLSTGQLTNGITLQTLTVNGPLAVTLSAGWGAVSLSTNSLAGAQIVRVPITVEYSSNQIAIATMLMQALELSTYGLSSTAPALSNYNSLTQPQTVTGQKTFISPIETNDTHLNPFFSNPKETNAVNYGNAFSSPSTFSGSEQFGQGATALSSGAQVFGAGSSATGSGALAVGGSVVSSGANASSLGSGSTANGPNTVSIGAFANSAGQNSSALGEGAIAGVDFSTALGVQSHAGGTNSTAVGQGATALFNNSTALGQGVATTATNQLMLGQASQHVDVPGSLNVGGSINNITHSGTNNYPAGADIAFGRYSLSSLANGNNAAVVVGTNVFVQVSGPTGPFTINGIAGGRDGKVLIILNRTGQTMTLANDSGVDPTAANRLFSNSGADESVAGNSTALLIYNAAVNHWIIIMFNNGTTGAYSAGYAISLASGVFSWNGPAQLTNHVNSANVDGFVANANNASALVGNTNNKLPPISITPGSSPFNYTNGLSENIFVWVELGTVSNISINGSSTFGSTGQIIPLQPGEWITVTYSGAPPGMFYKPF